MASPCAGEMSGAAGSGAGAVVGGALDVPPVQTSTRPSSSTAIALYRAMEMTFWLPQTEAALAQVEGR